MSHEVPLNTFFRLTASLIGLQTYTPELNGGVVFGVNGWFRVWPAPGDAVVSIVRSDKFEPAVRRCSSGTARSSEPRSLNRFTIP